MSVVLNFNYMVIKKSILEKKYPDGLDAFRHDWMPADIGEQEYEDPFLLSFISMGGYLDPIIDKLIKLDIIVIEKNHLRNQNEVYIGSEVHGPPENCEWLEFDYEEGFLICWLKGEPRGKLAYANLK